MGLEAFQDRDYKSAVQHFSQAIQQEDSPDAAYSNRCIAYLLMELPQLAIEDCTAALQLDPSRFHVQFYRGLVRYRLAQYEQASIDFTRYLQQSPQDARAYYNRGLAVFAQGQVEQALGDYQQAMTYASMLTPLEISNLYNDLGVAYLANTQFDAAIAALDQAIVWDDSDPRAYFNRGCACQRQGNYAAALRDFEQVLALEPNYAEAYLNRSWVKHEMGHHREAIADLEAALDHFQRQGDDQGVQRAKIRLQQLAMPVRAIG
ncbi:MAG: tetratricopeptide repeat protein [Cyanobacteria bacterium J06639_14]